MTAHQILIDENVDLHRRLYEAKVSIKSLENQIETLNDKLYLLETTSVFEAFEAGYDFCRSKYFSN